MANSKFVDLLGTASAYPYTVPRVVAAAEALTDAQKAAAAKKAAAEKAAKDKAANAGKGQTSSDNWAKLDLSAAIPDALEDASKGLDKILAGIDVVLKVLSPILDAIELFMMLFSSFTKALVMLVEVMQLIIRPIKEKLATTGIYVNALVPPALMKISLANFGTAKLSSGGFNGFLNRLNASLTDPNDQNSPQFGPGGIVGGAVIVVDAMSPDKIFQTLQALDQIFDFVKMFGFMIDPPPPINFRAYPTSVMKDDKQSYCVKLKWDKPSTYAFGYMITRSQTRVGKKYTVDDYPKKISGWIELLKKAMAGKDASIPQRDVYVYEDKMFNNGKPVFVNPNIAGGGEYNDFDFNIALDKKKGQFQKNADPVTALAKGKTPDKVYYVIQSVCGTVADIVVLDPIIDPPGVGPGTAPLVVTVRTCNNLASNATATQHPGGFFEFSAPGLKVGAMGSWTSMQIGLTLPWIGELIDFLDKKLEELQGLATDASDSFIEFVKQIQKKIKFFVQLMQLFSKMIIEIKKILSGLPSVAFLLLPPEIGGNDGFVNRIRSAKVSPNDEPFSGPDGITLGIVLMYGYDSSVLDAIAAVGPARDELQKTFDTLNAAVTTIGNFFAPGSSSN